MRPETLPDAFRALDLPCGQCTSCKLNKTRTWGIRIVHEVYYIWERWQLPSCFITLTYDEKHLPIDGSLVPKHLQDFIKRLRERLRQENVFIRHYSIGEYGTTCVKHNIQECIKCGPIQRPHYHAIIMGYAFNDRRLVGNRMGNNVYESELLNDTWGMGFTELGSATFESAAYCARYLMKKINGPMADQHYIRYCWKRDNWYEVEKEFAYMSTKPGIGKGFAMRYQTDLLERDECPIPGRGSHGKMPKYYLDKFEEMYPEFIENLKENRRTAMAESLLNGPSLESRFLNEDAKLNQLTRPL